MVRQHDTDSLDREKSPSLDFETAFPYVDLSLEDDIEDANRPSLMIPSPDRPSSIRSSSIRSSSIRPLSHRSGPFAIDHESDGRAKLCVFGSFLFLFCSAGFNGSLGTIQSYFNTNQLKSHTNSEIGWILGTYLFLACIPSFSYGSLLDRYGPRLLSAIGGIFSTATFLIMGQCKTYWQFMLCFGVFGSIGAGINCTVAVGVVGKLFVRRQGLAMGVAVTGASLGATIFPLVLRSTFENLGWVWSMRIVAIVIASSTSIGFLCFLPFDRLVVLTDNFDTFGNPGSAFNLSAWRSPSFIFVSCSIFLMEFVNCGVGGLLPTISAATGLTAQDGFSLLSVIGGTSCVSRLIIGILSDHLGGVNIMVGTMVPMTLLMSLIFAPCTTSGPTFLYAFAAFWGLLSGSFYTVAPMCISRTCDPKDFARYYGSTNLLVGVALLIANPLSGVMLEKAGVKPLAYLYLGIILAAGVSITVARGLVLGTFTTLRARI
ncbi:monocarboxylate transporter 2 [Fusarium agapanthi]|uniref:Monocarboxylate transporter 2 n=1 Tax=Fusarium agapanthi TaxID=1803897 RepID=A0A9P5E9S1_9HYPO|nr:monocarboxylate transporter 2 [Fusarium agapanthi]